MAYFRIFYISLFIICCKSLSQNRQTVFTTRNHYFMNMMHSFIAPSSIACAKECAKVENCLAFDFIKQNSTCQFFEFDGSYSKKVKSKIPLSFVPKNCRYKQYLDGMASDGNVLIQPVSSTKTITVYCAKMNTNNPLEYLSVDESENWSDQPPSAGRVARSTRWRKIRIDLEQMVVMDKDKTFAADVNNGLAYGKTNCCQVSYGKCGTFRVNINGTGLRFSKEVVWKKSGYREAATITIHPDRVLAYGSCGGYCGGCQPTPGVFLEII